jgi:hypothetical protein
LSGGRLVVIALLLAAPVRASTLFDPAFRFRTIRTPHFVIHFHQGEDRLAGRLAIVAEEVWRALEQPFGVTPPRLTHVVIADQSERAGGWATPVPYNTIVLDAAWPSGSDLIGNTDDWLRLVFGHEFTHITHLDRSESWARIARNVFGRVPLAFPNLYLPTWQIEGLATYEESALTGEGRLHDGNFRAIEKDAARAGALERLDRVNGGLVDWPGGQAAYAYGAGFHQYLAERFGPEKLAALAGATARRVPYTGSRVFPRIYGKSLGELWSDYQAGIRSSVAPATSDSGLVRLTQHRYTVVGPRFDRFACAGCPPELVYSVLTPHSLPELNRIRLDGTGPRRLTTRILGSTTAIGRDAIYFDQEDLRRNAGVYSDLYEWSRASGRVTRLTSEARVLDPDLSPDGTTLVAVQNRPGQRDLVLLRRGRRDGGPRGGASSEPAWQIETLISEADTQFNAPRWSPDGRTIAVERHRFGAQAEVALVDVATRAVQVVAGDARGRVTTPAWRPDGRAVVVAMARENEPSSLYEIDLDAGAAARRLTHLTGGATWPDVSPDGRLLAFVGYTAEGFELFSMPYPERTAEEPEARVRSASNASGARDAGLGAAASSMTSTAYSPLGTLLPTSWWPVITTGGDQLRMGATIFGSDVLGYHLYQAAATWLVASPAGSQPPAAQVPDWQVSYTYARWRPALFASASMETSFFTNVDRVVGPQPVTLRERQVEAGLQLPIVHVRRRALGQVSFIGATDDYTLGTRQTTRDRLAARAAGAYISSHRYAASISSEDGVAAGVTAEFMRPEAGSSADGPRLTGDVRAYLPAFGRHHVIAMRAVGATNGGDLSVGRAFRMGGSARDTGLIDFSTAPTTLMRGFPSDTFAGSHAALVNVEYRLPLARPQRGHGTWPLFLRAVHTAVFSDVGEVWTAGFRAGDVKASFGAELSVDVILGFQLPVTATVGGAWGRDGSGRVPDHTAFYVQLGHAF